MFIYPIYYHNWRNIRTVYIYNKTSIKRNILTIKKILWKVGQAKDLPAPWVICYCLYVGEILFLVSELQKLFDVQRKVTLCLWEGGGCGMGYVSK